MKAIALTYDYDLEKMKANGRFWAEKVYSKDVSMIFKYSAASYATFLHHNPEIPLELYTNDIEMLKHCMEQYDVNTDNVTYIDYSNEIKKSKEHHYIFQPLVDMLYNTHEPDEYRIRIDNDLIWKNKIPKINEDKDVLIWKFERYVRDGNPKMGEILVCQTVLNNIDFKEYNVGVLGYPKNYPMQELYDTCNKMSEVDILPVSDLGTSVWHVCEQTAESWIFHKYGYNIIETFNFVDHHTDNKLKCLEDAKFLLKKK
jgi:hypothetical protein